MQKITPFLMLDGRIEEAVEFYTSLFRGSRVISATPMSATIVIEGQELILFNGGPHFRFSEAVSFMVQCTTQEDVDYHWTRLLEGGGTESQCGWLKDRFGLSWQVIPEVLPRYLGDADRKKADRVMQAMLQMRRIDIAALEQAYVGQPGQVADRE